MDLNGWSQTGSKMCALRWAFVLALGAAAPAACERPEAQAPAVRQDVAQALADAEAQQRPVVLFFHASWCSACRALRSTSLADARVGEALGRAQATVVQVEVGTDFTTSAPLPEHLTPRALGVVGLPTLVYLDGRQGLAPQARLSGYVGPQRLIEWLTSAP